MNLMLILAGSTSEEIGKNLAESLGIGFKLVESKVFPDGESYIRIPEINEDHVLLVYSLYYPQDTHLFQLLNIISTLKRISIQKITLFIPYMCYARADRDILGNEAISAQTVLELIERSGIDHLIVLDIHNPMVLKKTSLTTTNIIPAKSLNTYLRSIEVNFSDLQVVAPDQGASERAKIIADELGVPWTALKKSRDPKTGELNMEIGEANILASEILLVDDISATGSSLIRASNLLRVYGVRTVHVFITHLLNPVIIEKLLESCGGILLSSMSIPSIISLISPVEDLLEVF